MMPLLNLPSFQPRLQQDNRGSMIYDEIRQKYVRLTPEEWVRQHFINLLINHLGFPRSLIVVEGTLQYLGLKKRFDLLVYNSSGKPRLITECKAPEITLDQAVFNQIAAYNFTLKVEFLVVTNGLLHYACRVDHALQKVHFLENIPDFHRVCKSNP